MLFEQMLVAALVLAAFFMIILPLYKFFQPYIFKAKKDPIKEAKIRLEVAKSEFEAAKINKEAEEYYEKLYNEALADSEVEEFETLKKKV